MSRILPRPSIAPRLGGPDISDIRWLRVEEFLLAKGYSPNTRKNYRRELRRFADAVICPWGEVTPRDIINFCIELKDTCHLRNASLNRAIAPIRVFFQWLHKTYPDQCPTNPAATIESEPLPLPPADDLTAAEVREVWEAIFQETDFRIKLRDCALYAILQHGLRAGEAVALNVRDYDGSDLHILEAKDDSTGEVPVHLDLKRYIDTYLDWRSIEGDPLEPESPLLLAYSRGAQSLERLTYGGVYYLCTRKWQSRCRLPIELNPHRLRHTFATQLMVKIATGDMDSVNARTLTRHKSESSFLRYAKRERIKSAKAAFHRVFDGETPFGFHDRTPPISAEPGDADQPSAGEP